MCIMSICMNQERKWNIDQHTLILTLSMNYRPTDGILSLKKKREILIEKGEIPSDSGYKYTKDDCTTYEKRMKDKA